MVKIYARLVKAERMSFYDVPTRWRDDVAKAMYNL